jgi:hypothetical protein
MLRIAYIAIIILPYRPVAPLAQEMTPVTLLDKAIWRTALSVDFSESNDGSLASATNRIRPSPLEIFSR